MCLSWDGYLNKRLVSALDHRVDFVNNWSTKMFFSNFHFTYAL